MRPNDHRRLSTMLIVGQVVATIGIGLVGAPAAADTRAPRIVAAVMKDTDGDDRADRIVLTYNERINHLRDDDGRYPFKLTDPSYGIRRVNAARSTKTLVILIREKPASDIAARPDVTYSRTRRQPVRDLAGNQARDQRFTSTKPRPCPLNATTDVYANPVVTRTNVPPPTGVSFPAWCTYPTLTAARNSLVAKGGLGRVIATGAGSGPAVFRNEAFPLSLPEGMVLTTSGDPVVGGAGFDATKYVVNFKGTAANALVLQGGEVKGMTFKNARAQNAAAMVRCAAGSSEIGGPLILDGGGASGDVERGLSLQDGCTLSRTGPTNFAWDVRVLDFAGSGIVVEEGADLTLTWAAVYGNGDDGIWVQGTAFIGDSHIAFNADDGIFVDSSDDTTIASNLVRDNEGNGIQVNTSGVSIHTNDIYNNSFSMQWLQPQVLFVGPPTDGVLLWTGTACRLAYPFGGGHGDTCDNEGPNEGLPDACQFGTQDNRVFRYNTSDVAPNSATGVYAAEGAVVAADFNTWWFQGPAEGIGADINGSYIDNDRYCGIYTYNDDSSDEPIP